MAARTEPATPTLVLISFWSSRAMVVSGSVSTREDQIDEDPGYLCKREGPPNRTPELGPIGFRQRGRHSQSKPTKKLPMKTRAHARFLVLDVQTATHPKKIPAAETASIIWNLTLPSGRASEPPIILQPVIPSQQGPLGYCHTFDHCWSTRPTPLTVRSMQIHNTFSSNTKHNC